MKASKKVIGSVAVSGLAVALMVTAVSGNQVLSADRTAAAAESQLVKNGMAGFCFFICTKYSRNSVFVYNDWNFCN